MVDLLCCENGYECRAYLDPVLLDDDRVLQNLLSREDKCDTSSNLWSNLKSLQTEVTPKMRKIVADWMLEVCEEQRCQEEVFPLAMNYMDRFLSVCTVTKTHLQLLGAVCLFLSSKLKESRPLPAEKLVIYTDNSICLKDLLDWEILVLAKLKWDISAITPNDFVDHILRRLQLEQCVDLHKVKRHAQTFIALCATDYKFSLYPPSMIAAASIGAAIQGLGWGVGPHSLADLLDRLHKITTIESDCLKNCLEQIEEMVEAVMNSNNNQPTTQAPANHRTASVQPRGKLEEHEKAETPTDVRDIHF